jgi:GntR family transcriptional regulator / MocR family aminotransferase
MRTSSSEVLIEIDRSRPRSYRAQVEDELRQAIRSGRLAPGTLLPSTRSLAGDLGVTRGVIVAAYDQLLAEGFLRSRPGSGTIVNCEFGPAPAPQPQAPMARPLLEFRPGWPDLNLFPRSAWLRATRAAMGTMPSDQLGYIDPRGLPELRGALADYLSRVRGVAADRERVVICNGFAHGLTLAVRALQDAGHDSCAIEDPGHDGPRSMLSWLGVGQRAVAVDDDGLVVDDLRRSGARAVLVTPAHQYPTGVLLSPSRRVALVEWAREVDGYIIEDDYDAEYRYDRHPVGALQGIAPDRVIYSGTVSKSLAPGLRLGWLVLPEPLVDRVAWSRRVTDHATPSIAQATYASFLSNGDLDRHLRRTRRIYRHRRDAVIAALAKWFPDATVSGIAAGLHVLVTLPCALDDTVIAARALAAGVRTFPLTDYRLQPRPESEPALVLGYGRLTAAEVERGVQVLAEVVAAAG